MKIDRANCGEKKKNEKKETKNISLSSSSSFARVNFCKIVSLPKNHSIRRGETMRKTTMISKSITPQPTLNKLETKFPPFINRNIKCTISNTLGWPRK